MIGDLVQVKSCACPNVYKITKIEPYPKPGEYPIHVDRPAEGLQYTFLDCDEIEAIPLTEEILKKNGFTDVGDCIYQNEEQCCGVELNTFMFYVYVNDYDNDNCHDVAQVFNVHQLQHALRLVGLNELADSIKVE